MPLLRTLGKTGIDVFPLGFGGIPIQRIDRTDAVQVIQRALFLGVNLIDTARGYTDSEEKIGLAIKGRQQKVYLATKSTARTREGIITDVHKSMECLGVKKIDIYQLHGVNDETTYNQVMSPGGAWEGLKETQRKGWILHIGITSHRTPVLINAMKTGKFNTIMPCFNFIENECEKELLGLAEKMEVGVLAMKPFGGGMIEDASLTLRYIYRYSQVVPIPGMEKITEVEENVAVATGSYKMIPSNWKRIKEIRQQLGAVFCRRCGYCQPCPEEISISAVLNARSIARRLPISTLKTGWVYEAYTGGKDCQECGECEEKCPYHLPIRKLIKENIKFLDELYARI